MLSVLLRHDDEDQDWYSQEDFLYRMSKSRRLWALGKETATLLLIKVVHHGSPDVTEERFRFEHMNNESARVADTKRARELNLIDAKANKERSEASIHENVAHGKATGTQVARTVGPSARGASGKVTVMLEVLGGTTCDQLVVM